MFITRKTHNRVVAALKAVAQDDMAQAERRFDRALASCGDENTKLRQELIAARKAVSEIRGELVAARHAAGLPG